MRCQRIQLLYEEYARGEVEPAVLAGVDEHLAGCAACRRYYEENDNVAELIRSRLDTPHPGPSYFADLNARVLAQLDADAQDGAVRDLKPASSLAKARRPLWWAGGAAAAALLAVAFLPEFHTPSPPTPPSKFVASGQAASSESNAARTVALNRPKISVLRSEAVREGRPTTLELMLRPVLDAASGGIATLVATQPSARSAATTLYKSVTGRNAEKYAELRDLLAQTEAETSGGSGEYAMAAASENGELSTLPTRRIIGLPPVQEADSGILQVRMEAAPALQKSARTPRLNAAALLDEALAAAAGKDGAAAMAGSLRDLEKTLERRSLDLDAAGLTLAKQVRLYLEAEDTLAGGDPMSASRLYRRILLVDEDSPLAQRSRMRIADLSYGQWGDFASARQFYEQSLRGRKSALSEDERQHARRQLDRLERYNGDNWRLLTLAHAVRSEGWPQAMTALRALSDDPAAADLMPEAARNVVERLKSRDKAPSQTALEVYRVLDARAAAETSKEIRAWLELALGDLSASQYKDAGQALARYRKAADAGAGTDAARLAKLNIDSLLEQSPIEHLR